MSALMLFALVMILPACEKDDAASTEVENFVTQSVFEIDERCGAGMNGCYELVFPITIQFADSTTAEVGSYDELKQAIRQWYEDNAPIRPRPFNRPTLVYPIEVMNAEGELITVNSAFELFELRRECIANFGPNHHGHKGRHCFKPVFPFSIEFPDGTQVEVTTPMELKQALREWKMNNPGVPGRPSFVFPITVQLRDGTQVTVNSAEELQALKEECRNG